MQRVLVIDSSKNPLMPCHPARARKLLRAGRAAVFRRYPFTIILTERDSGEVQPVTLKVDPGAKTTGIVLVVETKHGTKVVWAAELEHRGQQIKAALDDRRAIRRGRRNRKTRYRASRFDNRRRSEGWLPPSLMSRLHNIWTWCGRLYRFSPVTALSMELVRFDTQLMQNPEVSGVEYQQGELYGYEVREYLLEKWGRTCAYCGAKDVPLEVEHIVPKSRGGSNRVSNLAIACHDCNQKKGHQTAAEFGHPQVQAQAKRPLKDAAAVNATRWVLYRQMQSTGLPVEVGTGGRTKFNRARQDYPKAHWIDAACVGVSGEQVYLTPTHPPLLIKATGHGTRQVTRPDRYGFPRSKAKVGKRFFGFQTGDIVRADKVVGRVAVRSRPSFRLQGVDIHPRHLSLLHRSDGYDYL